MARSVGLDIGSRAVKVAVLDGGPKGAKLLRYAECEYEPGPEGALTSAVILSAVKKAFSEAKAPKQVVSVALPAEQCILREISVPFTQDDQIAKVVKFEFEPHLHNAGIEDVVLDYLKTGPARGGTRLLIFACLKSVLQRRLEQLKEVGIDPLHADIDMAALFNVAHASGALEAHPNCLIIDIGARTTKTICVQDGALKVARSIRLGADQVRTGIETDFEGDTGAVDDALADARDVEALALPPDGIADTMQIVQSVQEVENAAARARQSDFMARVLRETQRTLPVVGGGGGFTRIFLTGGGANNAHARQRIADHFGIEVEDLPVLDAVEHKLPPDRARMVLGSGAVAIGTALKVLGRDAAGVDLRQDDLRFARTFDQIKTALAVGATLLFFATFLGLLIQVLDKKKVDREYDDMRKVVKTEIEDDVFVAFSEAVTDKPDLKLSEDRMRYLTTVEAGMKKIRGKLKDELGLATEVPPILSCLKSWATVTKSFEVIRKQVEYLAVKSEKYDQDRAMITIAVGAYNDIDTITTQLRANKDVIANVNPRPPKNVDDKIEIVIELTLVPPTWENESSSSATDGTDGKDTAEGDDQ